MVSRRNSQCGKLALAAKGDILPSLCLKGKINGSPTVTVLPSQVAMVTSLLFLLSSVPLFPHYRMQSFYYFTAGPTALQNV